MLFQPTNITPDEKAGIGLGTFDVNDGMQISWKVNGNYPVMTAFQIRIFLRNTASTLLYDTGRLTNNCPFYGTDALGNPVYFSYTIPYASLFSHTITNGRSYKYTITQYYMDSGIEKSITQSSASTFITRSKPTFTISNLPETVESSRFTFQASYSQTEGDTLDWIRYRIARVGYLNDVIYDSGNLYGASVLETTFDGFQNGLTYAIEVTGQTSSGVQITASSGDSEPGWYSFPVSYDVIAPAGDVIASVPGDHSAVKLDWSSTQPVAGQTLWTIYRRNSDSETLVRIADIPTSRSEIYDFGAASGQEYEYLLFPADDSEFIGSPLTSNTVKPCFYQWSLLRAVKRTIDDRVDGYIINGYRVDAEYHFRYNLDSGSVSNNNTPNVLQNFTAKPTIQQNPQNYLSGTLSALVGSIMENGDYRDLLSVRNALMALSTTKDILILKSSKGDVKYVRINGNITAATLEGNASLAQSVSVPWIEEDDAGKAQIFDLNTDSIMQ